MLFRESFQMALTSLYATKMRSLLTMLGIILVTHEPEIAACASRQLLVRDGRITRDEGKGVVMDVV